VRQLLDAEGGPSVKVVAQIDTGSAIRNYDEILRVADAIMISRTNLGMVIRPEKVSALGTRGRGASWLAAAGAGLLSHGHHKMQLSFSDTCRAFTICS
jgi:hypothetical protein